MDLKAAAKATKEIMKRSNWYQAKQKGSSDAAHYDHIEWMLEGIEGGYIQDEKAHRWLGWAQGVICALQHVPLDVFKRINKAS
jgi:hypothetical protein